ncbi:mitogen-activated protein kinase kinase kinase 7 [Drosophila albomicans]|uniref:Mitogen-activated protein kinase kinase kinase 7 n=1 Tax=Drosophila albomicans TaxID=7291 RepID=A0A9C6TB62_DROAB|nr:mitogen-activated protein kinase kinase kinase 7 [Drosophila albomicans]
MNTIDFEQITLGDEIGSGSFGKVYQATYRNKNVAVKRINLNVSDEDFEREFKQLSRANHINIIFLHGTAMNQDVHYLVMEYVDGGSLFKLLYSMPRATYTINHIINWALQAAKGVAYLHAMTPKAVIHRDLKPHNMLLDNKHRSLKICDFGTVRYLSSMMTKNSGTAPYMAPEVFNGQKYAEKCDVYSWSITLWELFARKIPFSDCSNELIVCQRVEKGIRPALVDLEIECPAGLKNLMNDGWQTDPQLRPTMNDIVEALSKYPFDFEQLGI